VVLVALVVFLVDRASPQDAPAAAPAPTSSSSSSSGTLLDSIEIGYTDAPGYERDAFGSGWLDTDHNGCDTRNDILARDLETPTFKPGTHDCVVLTGTLHDPYTGTTIDFQRGNTTSEAVQIDHIVPLSWSWSHGAATWTDNERERFANDPANLRAVDGPTNGSKSDSGPADWLPPASAYDCLYVTGFVAVLAEYHLSIDEADAAAARTVLLGC
jgi:hypothetical protein